MSAFSHDAFVAAVEALHDRGWMPVPVPRGTKRPVLPEWQLVCITKAEIPPSFPVVSNVGVLLGEPSGGLLDIDLDSSEARMLAPLLLPRTPAQFGRASAPASHWLYRVDAAPVVRQYRDPAAVTRDARAMLVECRWTGAQTLVPPSIHPSGEAITWIEDGEPAPISMAELQQAVSQLAAAALLARHWPGDGNRHAAAMALAGGLLRGGMARDRVTALVRGVASTAGDPEVDDRVRTVAATHQALQDGRNTTGWRSLASLVDTRIARKAREWIGSTEPDGGNDAGDGAGSARTSADRSPFKDSEPSQATRIAELARDAGFQPFSDQDGNAYCAVPYDGHVETWPIKAEGLKHHLSRVYFAQADKVPSTQMLTDARHMLEGEARFEGPVIPVGVRVMIHGDTIYLDQGDPAWSVIVISSSGWDIVAAEAVPVRFRRPAGMLPLPEPSRQGSLDNLRALLNLGEETDFLLLVGWVLSVLYPRGPRPALQVLGEQGSAKSSAARLLRTLVDPNVLPLRAAPKTEDDLLIAARNSAVVAYDNLSSLPRWLSDAFCRLATGGGLSKRELYTDADEVLLDAKRPVLLTGISDVATASDLLDRCITVTLPPIPPDQRRTERDLNAAIADACPRVLGALLDAAVYGLGRVGTLVLDRAPRMADFAAWVEACAPALGWEPGHFVEVFMQNRRAADAVALESSPIGPAIVTFMAHRERWEGTASDLLDALKEVVPEAVTKEPEWPKRANRASTQLRRLAPNLRSLGIDCVYQRATQGRRLITLVATEPAGPPDPDPDEANPAGPGTPCWGCGEPTAGDAPFCPACAREDVGPGTAGNDRWTQ